jgi:hypothetical protein
MAAYAYAYARSARDNWLQAFIGPESLEAQASTREGLGYSKPSVRLEHNGAEAGFWEASLQYIHTTMRDDMSRLVGREY